MAGAEEGYWPDPSDVVASEGGRTSGTLVSPPAGWPGCFKENATLKAFMGKKALGGKRCRLTALPSAEDAAKGASLELDREDSFSNALAAQRAFGWDVIKGFVIYSLAEDPADAFVAHKRWWNAKESGIWVDFTPRPAGFDTAVLLESALATKSREPLTEATRAAIARRRELGGFATAPGGGGAAPRAGGGGAP